MAKTVNLKIDNRDVQVPEGTNLIEAAAAAGIHIPNLCYIKGMKGIGACRLCMVEVEGMKAPMIGCTTRVKEGMSVRTDTPQVQEIRKFVIDLILSMHPLDCMTCTKAGVCNLQKYAYDFELKESSFTRKNFGYPIDTANPFIKRDPDYCVLCGRCVRICKHQGTEVLDFNGRGVGSRVVTAQDKPLQESACTFCGSCVDVCPVNALLEADRWRKGREWEYEKTDSVCLSCGSGCSITVSARDNMVIKISSGAPDGSLERTICAFGRFGFDSIYSEMRVRKPMKRVGSELQETTWEDAAQIAADKLKAAGSDAAIVTSAAILNEDAALLVRLGEAVTTKNIDSTVSLYSGTDAMKAGGADLEAADLIILAGIEPSQWKRVLPALDAVVRKKINSGSKLIVINSKETNIAAKAAATLAGDEVKMLMELGQAIISKGTKAPKEMVEALAPVNPSDDAMAAADLFLASKTPVILAAPSLYGAAANLALIKGEAVAVPLEANSRGVVAMGLVPGGKKFSEIVYSSSSALYVIGEIPVSKRPETGFLIVQAPHMTDLAAQADLVLPAAAPLESEGTVIDWLGRIKKVNRACAPSGEARQNGDIFMSVGAAMGVSLKAVKEADIKKAAKTKSKAGFSPFRKDSGRDADPAAFMQDTNKSTVNGSRLLWLKELEQCAVTA